MTTGPRLTLGQRIVDCAVSACRGLAVPKYRLLSPLVSRSGTRGARIFGSQMQLDLSDHIQRCVYLGCYEREETALFRAHVGRGATVIDIGANIGYYTAFASSLVGEGGRVFAIEPSPRCFIKLDALVRENRLANTTTQNIGLSDQAGEMTLYEPLPEVGNLNSTMMPQERSTPVQVRVRTLDEVIEEQQIARIDMLKIDVEGHEVRVFKGARRALERRAIQTILCEVNDYHLAQNGTNGRAMMQLLGSFGFDVPAIASADGAVRPGHRNFLLKLGK